ncbi:S1 family peptidase [Candidatus Marimicrobium litorale]|uniref:S1 family peptidase n=1 Tax=Candidatus Marimicrobium litorale TaxID=2518991 RepID=UPI00242B4082|nr:serine protease [Candidatus Marimicrobium litorale]
MITANVFNRVFFIKVEQYGTGTVIDVDGKQYLVTARHLLGESYENPELDYFHANEWKALPIKVVGISRTSADVAVFATNITLCPANLPLSVGSKGMVISQDLFFLGFPYTLRTDGGDALQGRPCPFIRKGILSSAFDDGTGDAKIYIDATNNIGFSGGPIVFQTAGNPGFSVAGIVSGYRTEAEDVICEEGERTGWTVVANTGLTIGYDIDEAVKLIQRNPIGHPV